MEGRDKNSVVFAVRLQTTEGGYKVMYTALIAPSKPKKQLVTDGRTDQPTDGRTSALIESLPRD